jgi:hypothetical protein
MQRLRYGDEDGGDLSLKGMSTTSKIRVLNYFYIRYPDWIGSSEIIEALIVENTEAEHLKGTFNIPTRGELRYFLGRSPELIRHPNKTGLYRMRTEEGIFYELNRL